MQFGTGGEGDDSASSTDRASRFYRGLNDLLHETTGAIFSLAAFFPLAYKLPTASNRRVAATVRAMNTVSVHYDAVHYSCCYSCYER